MRVSLLNKMKPDSYTESCMVNAADRWERKKRVVPREVCVRRPEKGNRYRKVALNTQKSAEVIVAEKRRTESIGVLSTTWKGGMSK